jgi:hypothetical protein
MNNMEIMFKESFGIPIGQIIPLENNLVPIDGSAVTSLMFGSPVAAEKQFLIQSDIDQFITSCPQGYFLVGFWGHGISSHAFYYSRVDSWSRIFFRLSYGGVYTNKKIMAKFIKKFLKNYFSFEKKVKETGGNFIAIESMRKGYYKIDLPDKNVMFEVNESLLAEPTFEEEFGDFVRGFARISGTREDLDRLKARAEEIYEEMFEASSPAAAGAYFSEVKEIFFTAVNLAKEMGLEDEVMDIRKRLEHIKSVYESQMQ